MKAEAVEAPEHVAIAAAIMLTAQKGSYAPQGETESSVFGGWVASR